VIVVETSALVAILQGEPERQPFREIIADSDARVPVSCYLETAIALRKRGMALAILEGFVADAELTLLASDTVQARIAAEADRRYGRGTGHPARLNFGDCLAYAAAVAHDAPLLFKGADFARTDVRRALD
jgi:ribonuclease VapC